MNSVTLKKSMFEIFKGLHYQVAQIYKYILLFYSIRFQGRGSVSEPQLLNIK